MPTRKLTSGYVDWSGRDVRFATKDEKWKFHTEPFIITDAAIIPTKFGNGAFYLAYPSTPDGERTIGDPVVLVFHYEDSSPSRQKIVDEVKEARETGAWVGPLILFDFETGNDLGNPFVTFRNYEPAKTETQVASNPTIPTTGEFEPDLDEIPFS